MPTARIASAATVIRLLACLTVLGGAATTASAQQQTTSPKQDLDWPSPDSKFAFRTFYADEPHTIDLIDMKSGEKLQRIDDQDSSLAQWHVLWAPDSNRFALMTRLGHPIQGVDVFFRNGTAFRKIELPELHADIPERFERGKKFNHVANSNWQEATAWKKDGSLVMSITSMDDGESGSVTAERTVLLGFDRSGKVKVLRSTIKYETSTD
jgi:hypothetical protein